MDPHVRPTDGSVQSGLARLVARRRMVRAFTDEPVASEIVDGLIDLARRAPAAGNSQGLAVVVLSGAAETARYWDVTLPPHRRGTFRWPGLVAAPVLMLVLVRPDAWVERYAEEDKAATGLGQSTAAWPVPYWWVDSGMAIEHVLLGAVDAGLGACFFGCFDHEPAVLAAFDVPDSWRAVGAIAIGHAAPDEPGRSAARGRPGLDDVIHRGGW